MDFAYIGDATLQGDEKLLHRYPDSPMVLSSPATVSVSDFLTTVDLFVRGTAVGPAGDLLFTSHGDEEGNWFLSLDGKTTIPAKYEDIVKSTTIAIPAAVNGPQTWVRLKACLLGADRCHPFLVALKKALGNPSRVTAPRYLFGIEFGRFSGIWEYMFYEFEVVGPDSGKSPFADRAALKKAFVDKSDLHLIDGSPVPSDAWENWIPESAKLNLAPSWTGSATKPFLATVPKFGGLDITAKFWLAIDFESDRIPVPIEPLENDFIPAGQDTLVSTLNDLLPAVEKYKTTHDYPVYKRYGFNSLQDFTNGFKWTVKDNAGTTKKYSLTFSGSRYRYRLEVPVTKPGTNELIYNYYPDSGSPTINFDETNDPFHLFGTA